MEEQSFFEKNKKLLLALAAGAAVFAGVLTGYIDISFLGGIFAGGGQ
jgi:hypothetical protein